MIKQVESLHDTKLFLDPNFYSNPKLTKELIQKIQNEKKKPFHKVFVFLIASFYPQFFKALKENDIIVKNYMLNKASIVVEI